MKIKFLAKPPGTDYERDQVAEFNSNDWVEMTYADKYLREGLAEEVTGPPVDAAGMRTDGPTLDEYVKAGYSADSYPPRGYADKRPAEDQPPVPPGAKGGKGGKKT
jgi:hypothetical protein